MNIDIDKLTDRMDAMPTTFPYVDLKTIKSFEIKLVDCNGCENSESDGSLVCMGCENNPGLQNNFKPKQNELDKLFIGAPVMARTIVKGSDWEEFRYDGNIEFFVQPEIVRLPTVEEAPRNVWLAPWLKMPYELNCLSVQVRCDNPIRVCWLKDYMNAWNEVDAVMILEDFKK